LVIYVKGAMRGYSHPKPCSHAALKASLDDCAGELV
jgi:hypothetical protein